MDRICPVCNGLTTLHLHCKRCGSLMEDGGRAADYATPYAPYFPDIDNLAGEVVDDKIEAFGTGSEEAGFCTHLATCPQCGQDQRVPVSLVHA